MAVLVTKFMNLLFDFYVTSDRVKFSVNLKEFWILFMTSKKA